MKINNLEKIAATGKLDNRFVGIRINSNRIEFHYPESYVLSDNDDMLRKDILAILRTVSLARTMTSDMSTYNSGFGRDEVFPLGAYLWIINDYLTYGRYENREKEYVRGNSGRVSWKRTMRSNPVISDGNIVYTGIISEKKSQKDNLLTEIYFFCVRKAVDAIGWLYGVDFDPDGIDYYRLFNKKLYLGALNTELSHTFEDQKRTRLQNMKNVVTGLDEDQVSTREVIYGVDSYEYVYEKMVDSMFSNVDDIRSFYPNATWDLVVENEKKPSSNLRPDTVLIRNKKVYILDAKYYRYGTTFSPGDMPETTSIQKQITYGEYVKKVKDGEYDDVYSAFVLPFSKTENPFHGRFSGNMEFAGVAEAAWIDAKHTENSQKIAAILVDTNFLVSNWIKKDEDSMDEIISLIEKNVGGAIRE